MPSRPSAVVEIHLAGHRADPALGERLLIDSHDAPVAAPVWALFERFVERAGPRPTLIERDAELPPFAELLAERDQAHERLAAVVGAPEATPHAAAPRPSTTSSATFAAALLGEATSAAGQALAAQPGFAVYRNTVLRGCIDALAANYPTVATLVGGEWFDAAAGRFARAAACRATAASPPTARASPTSWRAFEPAAGLAYLAGVARLDRAWTEAHLAADAPVLTAARSPRWRRRSLLDAVLVPHPATRWVRLAGAADLHHLAPPSRARAARRRARLARRRRPRHPARRDRRLAGAGGARGGLPRCLRRKAGRSPSRPSVPARPDPRRHRHLAAGAGRGRRLHPPGAGATA